MQRMQLESRSQQKLSILHLQSWSWTPHSLHQHQRHVSVALHTGPQVLTRISFKKSVTHLGDEQLGKASLSK